MKKWLCLLMFLTFTMSMILVACDQGGEQGTTNQSEEQGTTNQSEERETEQEANESLYADLMWDVSVGDRPYDLYFSSNGDGTCSVVSVIINPEIDQPVEVEIPEKSPAGDTVIQISLGDRKYKSPDDMPFYFPLVVRAETFEALCAEMKENGISEFECNQFQVYYQRKSLTYCADDQVRQDLLETFPFVAGGDVYVFAPMVTNDEYKRICGYYQTYADWNDEKTEQCYNEIVEMAQQADVLEETRFFFSTMDFRYLNQISAITIPDSVTSIGRCAFHDCTGLTSITIPDSVTSIDDYAFWGCIGLTNVTIGNGITRLGYHMFDNCTGLTSIVIPKNVNCIDQSAFNQCANLTDIYYTGTEQEWAAITIAGGDNIRSTATIHYNYVPEE